MKKIFNYLCLAAIAATTLVACSKNESVENLPEVSVRTVNFSAKTANPSTKTAFGDKTDAGYPTVWTSNEKVSISLNFASGVAADVIPSSNGKTASFNATLTDDESGEYVFYALSPAVAAISWSAGDYNSVNVDFPANQAPTLKSVDEKAHIMAAKSTAFTEFPDEDTPVSLSFSHLAAYGKFQFRNLPETVKIESIELNAAEPVAGRFYFYPKTGEITANSVGTIVTLNVDNLEIDKNNTTDFWFSFKPVNLQGKTLKISVHTDNGVYSKTITFPSDKGNFQAGRVASFSVNMDGITPGEDKVYKLVTDKNQLLPNTKVIIVAKEFNYAIGVVQNSNNRSQAEVTKETSAASEAIIKNPGEAVQIFNLERGTLDNTVAFKCVNDVNADKYIGASGEGNHLRSYADLGDNTSFDVTIGDGSTLLVANSSSDFGNIIRYNSTNTNPGPIFSCYKASSSVQDEVALYALVGSGEGSSLIDDPKCPAPEISYNNSTKTVTITCSADGATVGYTTDGTDPEEGSASTTITDELPIEFQITATTTVKAMAGAPGYRMSDIAEKECIVSSVVDYVTLDWIVPETGSSLTASALNSIPGVTTYNLGSDYADSHKPYQVKFDGTGDYIQVKTDSQIGSVSVDYKMIGGASTSYLTIKESTDGETWNTVETLTISGAAGSTGNLTTNIPFASTSRFVKIEFTKGSNVGIGGISILKPSTNPSINASPITVGAVGATNGTASYTANNFTDDVIVASFTGCVTTASANAGTITYSVDPNYTTSSTSGTIYLRSASNPSVTATVNVSQAKSTLIVNKTEVIIPATATTAEFSVTTADFEYNTTVAAESGMNLTISSGATGAASSEAQTVTIASTTAGPTSGEAIVLGTITVYRNGNNSDPQRKVITIKKDVQSSSSAYYAPVTTISEGRFLMVYNSKAASGTTGKALTTSDITISNGQIASNNTVDGYSIEITSIGNNQYTLKLGGSYIGYSGSSTNLSSKPSEPTSSDLNYKWTITFNDDGTAKIVNVGTNDRYIGGNGKGASFTQFKAYDIGGLSNYPCPTLYKYYE